MDDEQARKETGGGPVKNESPPQPIAHNNATAGANPSQPLRRTPSFWQAVFAGALVLNAAVTSCLLFKQHQVTRQQLVGTQAALVTLGLSIYPNNALSVLFD